MKKLKIAGVILTSLFAVTAFAVNTGLTFDLSNQDQPDAQGDNHYFSCNVTKDNGTPIVSPTKITFTMEGNGINFNKGDKIIENLSVSDLEKNYFGVKKDQRGEGTLTYSTNNGSELVCAKGKGGRSTEYTGQ